MACSLLSLLTLMAAASAATAAPVDDARAEATRIEAELERQGEQISRLDEQYNRARIRAQQAETELGRERQGLANAEARLEAARQLMTRQALIAYVHGGNASVVDQLVRTDSRDLLVRPHYAGTVLADERRAVRELHDARRAL